MDGTTIGIADIWPEIRGWYSDDFALFIEDEIATK